MALYTVLGSGGFIGSSLVRHLVANGHECQPVGRDETPPGKLGHVIYSIGLTADFRTRPFDTINAHVCKLSACLQGATFDSFTYVSSTRVYQRVAAAVADENTPLVVDPADPSDLYNLSKLAGESLCLTISNPAVRVVRLSNVYGAEDQSDNFLTTILTQALTLGRATMFVSMVSAKDYLGIEDVVRALELIPLRASSRVLNLAAGRNVSNAEIAALVQEHAGIQIDVRADAPEIMFPRIDIGRMIAELGFKPQDIKARFSHLVQALRERLAKHSTAT